MNNTMRENSCMLNEKGVNSMEEVNEEIQTEKKEEQKASNFGVTLLFTLLAVIIGFTILICMQ